MTAKRAGTAPILAVDNAEVCVVNARLSCGKWPVPIHSSGFVVMNGLNTLSNPIGLIPGPESSTRR